MSSLKTKAAPINTTKQNFQHRLHCWESTNGSCLPWQLAPAGSCFEYVTMMIMMVVVVVVVMMLIMIVKDDGVETAACKSWQLLWIYQQLLPLLLSTADDHQHAFKQLGQTLALNFEIKIVWNLIDFPSTPWWQPPDLPKSCSSARMLSCLQKVFLET